MFKVGEGMGGGGAARISLVFYFRYSADHKRDCCLKKNLNAASRPSGHPPVRGGNVKTFRWDHRLQRSDLFMAFKRVFLDGSNIRSTI